MATCSDADRLPMLQLNVTELKTSCTNKVDNEQTRFSDNVKTTRETVQDTSSTYCYEKPETSYISYWYPWWPWMFGGGFGVLFLVLITTEWQATRPIVPDDALCSEQGTKNAFRDELHTPNGYSSCAVVGSAGFLRLQRLGSQIDAHDFVIRANIAPVTGFEPIVGSKTSMRVLNSEAIGTILREKVCHTDQQIRRSVCPAYPLYLNTGERWLVSTYRRLCPNTTIFDSRNLDAFDPTMRAQWQGTGKNLMSGSWALGIAMKLCPNMTTIYGVSHSKTFSLNNNESATYHYYDERTQSSHDNLLSSAQALTNLAGHQSTCMTLHDPHGTQLWPKYVFKRKSSGMGLSDALVDDLRHDLARERYFGHFRTCE